MSNADEPSHEHQVGITNAQQDNPDAEIRRLTEDMNALFAANQYEEAARIALSITALSKDELRDTFERHGVTILHLAGREVARALLADYPKMRLDVRKFIILMPKL